MKTRLLLLAATLLPLALAGCGGGSAGSGSGAVEGPVPPAGGGLTVRVTDAPFPYDLVESAEVTISGLEVRGTDGGWIDILPSPATIDLVPLVGGVSEQLVISQPDPGTYDMVRLIVEAGEVVLTPEAVVRDDRFFSTADGGVHTPSAAQTGIKVKIDPAIEVSTQLSADLILDFDLSKNFVFNGPATHAPGVMRVLFTPVVRAINDSVAGRFVVDVFSDNATPDDPSDDFPLEGAVLRALEGVTEAGTAPTDALGHAELSLVPGIYTVEVEAAQHETAMLGDHEIILVNVTDLGTVLLVGSGEIAGTVMSDGGTPTMTDDDVIVADVMVSLLEAGTMNVVESTMTDAMGGYRFEDLPGGTYDLDFSKAGFAAQQLTGVVATTMGTTADTVLLVPFAADLVGLVTDGMDPIVGATVVVENAAGVEVASTTTDATGAYAVSLVTGDYEVTATDGVTMASDTQPVTLLGADPVPTSTALDFVLTP